MKIRFAFIFIMFGLLAASCGNNKVRIALSKGVGSVNYELYGKWMKSYDPDIVIVNLYGLKTSEAAAKLKECDGLVLTGGPDVHPAYFNMESDTARCSIEPYRDSLEFELIKISGEMNIPVLAVCRGAQIMNVAMGGNLIIDIPDDTESEIQHQVAGEDVFHNIQVTENSLLYALSESLFGTVNSNHHQAVGRLADVFEVSAKTSDGIIEAYEYKDKSKPFFVAVQWHPERLDSDSRFSEPIGAAFVKAVKSNKQKLAAVK